MINRTFLMALCFLLMFSCLEDEQITPDENLPGNSINKIMPLGASRIEGARPEYESFRYELWKDLIDGNWDFDYIGTVNDESNYPIYSGRSFDADHEGRGGYTSSQILNGINSWLNQSGTPDIVLFSSPGGNDALEGLSYDSAIANINNIVDILQTKNPNVIILIEQMAPAHSSAMTSTLSNYLATLHNDVADIALNKTTTTSKVIAVDMYNGFNDSMLADDVHYNQTGAEFIASRYYNALINVLQE
ncbi:MAG: GDSL-type esterase/lipase family protein [Bacteroidota bacterium]